MLSPLSSTLGGVSFFDITALPAESPEPSLFLSGPIKPREFLPDSLLLPLIPGSIKPGGFPLDPLLPLLTLGSTKPERFLLDPLLPLLTLDTRRKSEVQGVERPLQISPKDPRYTPVA